MFWHFLLWLLSPIAVLISCLLVEDRDREILALRQQLLILQRQLGKRPRLMRAERLALLLTCLRMKKQQLLSSLLILKPDTVIGWHRQMVRRHWTFRQKRKPGRPRVDPEVQRLVLQIARENLRWSYTKIAGEVRKLGFAGLGPSTVERILKRHGLAPRPHHDGGSWANFLGYYYYNQRRPHRSLQLCPPDGPLGGGLEGKVVRRKVLGGLINDYHREAA